MSESLAEATNLTPEEERALTEYVLAGGATDILKHLHRCEHCGGWLTMSDVLACSSHKSVRDWLSPHPLSLEWPEVTLLSAAITYLEYINAMKAPGPVILPPPRVQTGYIKYGHY